MAAPKGISVSERDISQLREEDAVLEREINERDQRRAEIKRKLDAVDIVAAMMAEKEPVEHPKTNGAAEGGDSPAYDLVENLRKTGDSLKVKDLRRRLAEIGHKDKAEEKNYIYGLLYRLTRGNNPKLVKRGAKYRAAPISSPEGETEAGGASARH
jgi:hypothetical protein